MGFFFKFGATQNKNPLCKLRLACPDFLAVNAPSVAIKYSGRSHTSEIRTSTRFAKALAPIFFTLQNGRQETLLLFG